MLQVSDAYKELVKSNIRPKIEPVIKVSGKDNTGKEIELVWNAKNIKNLKYKRGIDPVGRELPYMELTWTEIYTGKLNAESYPEKYNNITKYMTVDLSFIQDLDFYNTWKTIFNGGIKWSEILTKTWKKVKKEASQETITMPKLFLSARPTIKGQTITWVAKDFLSFLNEQMLWEFDWYPINEVPLKNAISFFLLNSRGGFLNSPNIVKSCTDSATQLISREDIDDMLKERIICDGSANNIILNLASIYNYFLDFSENTLTLKRFNPKNPSFVFDSKILYKYPTMEMSTNISTYSFKHRRVEPDPEKAYYKEPHQYTKINEKYGFLYYLLNGYGEAFESEDAAQNIDNRINVGEINSATWMGAFHNDQKKKIYVVPVHYTAYDNIVNINNVGEVFKEDNPINPYGEGSDFATARKDFLNSYFSSDCSGISFEALANVALETNDVIKVETNLYDGNGNKIVKDALIVSMELTYNGSLKQKIKAHEVIL